MNKKILIIIIIILALLSIILVRRGGFNTEINKQDLFQKYQTLKNKYENYKTQGYDIAKVEALVKEAKQDYDRANYAKAKELLDKATEALERIIPTTPQPPGSTSTPPSPTSTPPLTSLNQVKVASVYERVSDGIVLNRSINDVINIFKETNTDLIFRGFFRWQPVPESSASQMPGYPANYVSEKTSLGYTYNQLGDAITQIKAAKPNTIFIGAIAAQRLNTIEFNDLTHESFTQSQTWAMAFDPAKFNLSAKLGSKEEIQCKLAKGLGYSTATCPSGYDAKKVSAYFPDITNEQYQNLLLSYAKKQIDLGADGIWIDMLFTQAIQISEARGNPSDPTVKAFYDASSKIIDEIHAYGSSKYNKNIYVGTWSTFIDLPFSPPNVDFVTVSVSAQEISAGSLNEGEWNAKKEQITGKIGNKPILVFIDWSGNASAPMGVFSQLNPVTKENDFLTTADAFFTKKGMIFVYPIHGGTFSTKGATRLAFGKYGIYDSLAPEFQTYDTIKELAQEKSKKLTSPNEVKSIKQTSKMNPNNMNKAILIIVILILIIVGVFAFKRITPHRQGNPPVTSVPTSTNPTSSSQSLTSPITSLKQVKVASVYERVSDGIVINRSMDDVINIFKNTNTDLVFRGFYRWQPVPESGKSTMPVYAPNYVAGKASIGYTYEQLGDAYSKIKAARPGMIIIGGIVAGRLNRIEFNDETRESFGQDQTWEMAWDPAGSIPEYSKVKLQCLNAVRTGEISKNTRCPEEYDPSKVPAYTPDITNEQFQELLLSEAEKQIDLGADGIWVDLLYQQAAGISELTGNPNGPAVKAAFEASSRIVDKIHEYGQSKYGKHIYVGTWWTFADLPYPPPKVDFVTATPSPAEVRGAFDDEKWEHIKTVTQEKVGTVPILVFIDWSGSLTAQMGVFSQTLTPDQQKQFITTADSFFSRKGMIFVYPIHGGTFSTKGATRLAFGKYGIYDSLAPEFQTYDTIKELAQEKSKK